MRFVVHGALKRHAIKRRFITTLEAAYAAWELMAAGAAGWGGGGIGGVPRAPPQCATPRAGSELR
jgi:hypothetical protein